MDCPKPEKSRCEGDCCCDSEETNIKITINNEADSDSKARATSAAKPARKPTRTKKPQTAKAKPAASAAAKSATERKIEDAEPSAKPASSKPATSAAAEIAPKRTTTQAKPASSQSNQQPQSKPERPAKTEPSARPSVAAKQLDTAMQQGMDLGAAARHIGVSNIQARRLQDLSAAGPNIARAVDDEPSALAPAAVLGRAVRDGSISTSKAEDLYDEWIQDAVIMGNPLPSEKLMRDSLEERLSEGTAISGNKDKSNGTGTSKPTAKRTAAKSKPSTKPRNGRAADADSSSSSSIVLNGYPHVRNGHIRPPPAKLLAIAGKHNAKRQRKPSSGLPRASNGGGGRRQSQGGRRKKSGMFASMMG